jgi:serine/threonine protein kinase
LLGPVILPATGVVKRGDTPRVGAPRTSRGSREPWHPRHVPSASLEQPQFGPFRLIERIAVGGMAEVFRALESGPGPIDATQTVVVKRMLPTLVGDREARAMFREEQRIGAFIRHENVVAQLGGGEADGTPYLVLELVAGLDLWRLGRWLTRTGRALDVALAAFVAREVLAGLAALHDARDRGGAPLGVVHRDVSPSNVLLSLHGDVKLADLGIASARAARPPAEGGSAWSARAKGKLGYLAPEQVRGEPLDQRADVFGAAVILAELLLGKPLFAGASELAVLLAIRDGDVRAFEERAAVLPSGLGEVVLAALARDREARTPTAAAFHAALAPFVPVETAVLRAELAALVRTAVAMLDDANEAWRPPLPRGDTDARTPPVSALIGTKRTMPESTLADDALTPIVDADGPPTGELPALDYVVVTTNEERRGPFTYARIVEAIATGRLDPRDRVSAGGGALRPIAEVRGLARHFPRASLDVTTREVPSPSEPDATFRIDDGGFVSALAGMIARADTGMLLCEQGGVRKEVYVLRGTPTYVRSNLASELLGEFLVARGVLSRGELDMALAVLPRFEGRLGDTLTALGLVEPVSLFRHIAAQVREKLLDLFGWTGGRATLWRGADVPESAFPLGLDGWAILEEGLARRLAQGLESLSAPPDAALVRVDPAPPTVDPTRLPEGARALYDGLTGPRPIDALPRAPGDPSRDVHVAALLLVRLGLARLA